MAAETATIRVTRKTRDLFAHLAGERGISVSAMLTELAHDLAREEIFRSEREASRSDAGLLLGTSEERPREAPVPNGD